MVNEENEATERKRKEFRRLGRKGPKKGTNKSPRACERSQALPIYPSFELWAFFLVF